MDQATIVAVLDRQVEPAALELVSPLAKWLEVRADLVADGNPSALRSHFRGKLLFTLRTRGQGGESDLTPQQRSQRLLEAARSYDYVDLEPDDLVPELLLRIPESQRVLSWHGQAWDPSPLLATPGTLHRFVLRADSHRQALLPLQFPQSQQERNIIAWADGPLGSCSAASCVNAGSQRSSAAGPQTT